MKSFSYSYRDKDWAIKSGTLLAKDRAEVLQKLKEQGCSPLSITEGSAKRPAGAGLTVPPRVLAGAAVSVVAIILVALFLTFRNTGGGLQKPEVKTKKPAVVELKKPAKKGDGKTAGVVTQKVAVAQPAQRPKVATQHPVGVNTPAAASPKEPAIKTTEDDQNRIETELYRPFVSGTEQLIAMLGLPGQEMPPLPLTADDALEEDFAAALTNIIVVLDKDDDHSVALKENVAWIKQFIKEGQAMGWTPGDYLRALEKTRQEEAALRQEAHKIMSEVESVETPPDAATIKAARDQLNKELTEQGIMPLDEPEE